MSGALLAGVTRGPAALPVGHARSLSPPPHFWVLQVLLPSSPALCASVRRSRREDNALELVMLDFALGLMIPAQVLTLIIPVF